MTNDFPISHILMAHMSDSGLQFVLTESHDGHWAMSDEMIAKSIRFAAEHCDLGAIGFQCVANGDPRESIEHDPHLIRLDFCRTPTARVATDCRFPRLTSSWRFRFLCVETAKLTPEILIAASDYDAVFMAPTQDELYGVIRLFLGPGNAIGFDLADILTFIVGRAVEVGHLAICDLPACFEAAEKDDGVIIGFSRHLTLANVDKIVSSLPDRPDGLLFHDTVCGIATMSAEVFVCRSFRVP